VTVSLVHFMRNLHSQVSQVLVSAALEQSFSIWLARGFLSFNIPDELHGCGCVIASSKCSSIFGVGAMVSRRVIIAR